MIQPRPGMHGRCRRRQPASPGFLLMLLLLVTVAVLFASTPASASASRLEALKEKLLATSSSSSPPSPPSFAAAASAENQRSGLAIPSSIDYELLPKEIIDAMQHSVVRVITVQAGWNWINPWVAEPGAEISGSGFVVEIDGELVIATNAHVVEHSVSVRVALPALFGQETFDVQVLAICHAKDVALLRLKPNQDVALTVVGSGLNQVGQSAPNANSDGSNASGGGDDASDAPEAPLAKVLVALRLGDSDKFVQGSKAVAVGYPLGQNNLKLSSGIVAGLEHVDDRLYLQVTSPISPGNSGGPLVSKEGHVMGINTAAIESASNVAYAIPTNHIHELFRYFIASSRPAPADPTVASMLSLISLGSTVRSEPDEADSPAAEDLFQQHEPRSDSMADPSVVKHFPTLGVALEAATEMLPHLLGYERFWRTQKHRLQAGQELCPNIGGVFVRTVRARGLLRDAGVQSGDLLVAFNGHCLDRFGEAVLNSGDGTDGSQHASMVETGAAGPVVSTSTAALAAVPMAASTAPSDTTNRGTRLNIYDLAERVAFGSRIQLVVWRSSADQLLQLSTAFEPRPEHLGAVHYVHEPLLAGLGYEVFGGLVLQDLTLNHVQHFLCAGTGHSGDSAAEDAPPCLRSPGMVRYEADETGQLLGEPRLVVADVIAGADVPANPIRPGELVVAVNGRPVRSLAELREHFLPPGWAERRLNANIDRVLARGSSGGGGGSDDSAVSPRQAAGTRVGGGRGEEQEPTVWWVSTEGGSQLAFDFEKRLRQERTLAGVFRYGLSEVVRGAQALLAIEQQPQQQPQEQKQAAAQAGSQKSNVEDSPTEGQADVRETPAEAGMDQADADSTGGSSSADADDGGHGEGSQREAESEAAVVTARSPSKPQLVPPAQMLAERRASERVLNRNTRAVLQPPPLAQALLNQGGRP